MTKTEVIAHQALRIAELEQKLSGAHPPVQKPEPPCIDEPRKHSGGVYFRDIKVGEHFMYGREHIKIADITTGCGNATGTVNAVDCFGAPSGFGPFVTVRRVCKAA